MTEQTKAQQTTNQQENKMNKQTKAQRLADWLDNADCNFYDESSMWFDSRLAKRVDQAAAELRRLDALNAELVEALLDVTASLVAAHNLLQNGGKKAAASDKMFSLMLNDYEKSFELGRAVLAKAKEQT